jgi:hypothetical protein
MSWDGVIAMSVEAGHPAIVELGPRPPRAFDWVAAHRESIDTAVTDHGAVLIRGLDVRTADDIAAVVRCLGRRPMVERDPFTTRTRYAPGVYSCSAWPSDQVMCMHHENSYGQEFPGLLVFCCATAPRRGGATVLVDAAKVLDDLPCGLGQALVDRFDLVGWQLLRTYNGVVGVGWAEAFGLNDRAEVERHCRDNDIEFHWDAEGGLRTRRRRHAIVHHPSTGERVWFNQIAFLNEWTMEPGIREFLVREFGPDGLPFNTRFGDGDPVDKATVDAINEIYAAHTVREQWRTGDLLLVDNIRTAHGREPYEGTREILVGMADPVLLSECGPPVGR